MNNANQELLNNYQFGDEIEYNIPGILDYTVNFNKKYFVGVIQLTLKKHFMK
jgi:uncharacterized membrane protein